MERNEVHRSVLHRATLLHVQSHAIHDGSRRGGTVAQERVGDALSLFGDD